MLRLAFVDPERAELLDAPEPGPVQPHEVRGKTVVTLVSPGTELNWRSVTPDFPIYPGYACVFAVEEAGSAVLDLVPGALVFYAGPHCQRQQCPREDVVPLPAGLAPETAVFARLAVVTMSTLTTTTARPPARVLVTGLGPVGNLAAQVFTHCGYRVTAVDPSASVAAEAGADLADQVALHLECSGHEQAALDGCRTVQQRGEVVLVGTPWKRRTDLFAFDLLQAVFHRYVVLRSGWEWEVPRQRTPFVSGSAQANAVAILEWLAAGSIHAGGMAGTYSPREATEVYACLANQSLPTPTAIFDWRKL
jgi:NADPH:quinone reductase-like Zn-dependent oxidoreductase